MMQNNRFLRLGVSLFAVSALVVGACSSAGTDEKGPPSGSAEGLGKSAATPDKSLPERADFIAGNKLYAEKLSETASIEFWDQGNDGVLLSVRGHKDYDADLQHVLEKAVAAEGSMSAARIYKHFKPTLTVMPEKLLQIDRMIEDRMAGRASGLGKLPSRPSDASLDADVSMEGNIVEAAEPKALPLKGEAPLTWMAVWFRDTFCSYPGHNHSICLLDRIPEPYISQDSTGKHHIITANTDYNDIRFRGFSTDCDFWCSWETRWDQHVYAGNWAQNHWLASSNVTQRRGRIDAWDPNNKAGVLAQFAMTWQDASTSNNSCRSTGQSCGSGSPCCLVPDASTQCLQGICQNDPTPHANCDWVGEFCCGGTSTSSTYCNRTYDSALRCNSGVCGH
ncbi:MAG TPA: hypothetical protein VFK05_00715 [Polyangiaceae bacterium]|nr:hypothetical protein [Polyangiaceae bacterium]